MDKVRKWYALATILGVFLAVLRWLSDIDTPVLIIMILMFSGVFIESVYSLIKTNKNDNN